MQRLFYYIMLPTVISCITKSLNTDPKKRKPKPQQNSLLFLPTSGPEISTPETEAPSQARLGANLLLTLQSSSGYDQPAHQTIRSLITLLEKYRTQLADRNPDPTCLIDLQNTLLAYEHKRLDPLLREIYSDLKTLALVELAKLGL